MKLRLTPTKNMLPRSSLSKSHLMPLSVVGSRLVRLGFFGFVFSFPNNELIFIIRLFALSCALLRRGTVILAGFWLGGFVVGHFDLIYLY